MIAAILERYKAVDLLLHHGASSINAVDTYGVSALPFFVRQGALVLEPRQEHVLSFVLTAIEWKEFQIADYLIQQDINQVFTLDSQSRTPLMRAITHGSIPLVTSILKHMVKAMKKNSHLSNDHARVTASRSIIQHDHESALQVWIDAEDQDRSTALILATKTNQIPVIRLLLKKYHLNIGVQDVYGMTALLWAVYLQLFDAAKILAQHDVNQLFVASNEGCNPFLLAISSRQMVLVEYFLKLLE